MGELYRFIVGVIQEVLGDKLSQSLTRAGVALVVALAWDVLGWIWGLPFPILGILFFASFALTLHTSSYITPHKNKQPSATLRQELLAPEQPKSRISIVKQPTRIEQAIPVIAPKALEAPTEQKRRKSIYEFNPAEVTPKEMVDFFSYLKQVHEMNQKHSQQRQVEPVQVQVRIVALQEHIEFAKLLVNALEVFGYDILVNDENVSYIFIARDRHDKLIVRYRKTGESLRDSVYRMAASSFVAFDGYDDNKDHLFPPKSDRDYIQVELGGSRQ